MPELGSKIIRLTQTDTGYSTSLIDGYRRVRTYKAGGTIAAGNVIAIDQSQQTALRKMQYVVACPVSASGEVGYGGILGVALEDASAEEDVDVVIAGLAQNVDCNGTVSSGNELVADVFGGDAGHCRALALNVASTGTLVSGPFGCAVSVSSGGKCSVYVYPRAV